MTKAELRRTWLARRKALSPEEASAFSRQIGERLLRAVDLTKVQYLHVYLPMLKYQEIDTYQLIELVRSFYPDTRIVVPKADPDTNTLESYRLDDTSQIQVNRWGIPEPVEGERVAPQKIDCIILPLLAFDERGYRVGYGKGFYDRYLVRCRPDAVKVGLSYFPPVARIADVDAYDVKMDFCVTPEQVWSFGKPA